MTGPRIVSPPSAPSSSIASLTNRRRPLLRRGFGVATTATATTATTAATSMDSDTRQVPPPPPHHHQQPIMPSTDNTAVSLDCSSTTNMEDEHEQAIHVAVRFRPLNAKELSTSSSTTTTATSPHRPTVPMKTSASGANHNNKNNGKTSYHHNHHHQEHHLMNHRAWNMVAAGTTTTAAVGAGGSNGGRQQTVMQKGATRKVEGRTVFTFDSVFGEQSTTLEVYHCLAKPLLEAVLRGQHGTIFAYGQTGSGKTYTMHGIKAPPVISTPPTPTPTTNACSNRVDASDGIIHMTLQDMFQQMQILPERDFRVRVSFFEIYNEKVRDLLMEEPEGESLSSHGNNNNGGNGSTNTHSRLVQVRGDPTGVHVNCREEVIHNMEQAKRILAMGHANRASASTYMNERSSRSHAIFRITVESCDKKKKPSPHQQQRSSSTFREHDDDAAALGQVMRVAVLNLVDLSGSENARLTGNTGQRQREGGMINQSLLSLSQVIYSLSLPPKKRPSYINYRDSKLTRILQPHLSGNARIAILCCATPSTKYLEETRATLMFASRAKLVQTKPQVNEILDDKMLLKRLIRELDEARQAIRQLQDDRQIQPDDNRTKQVAVLPQQKLFDKRQRPQPEKLMLQDKPVLPGRRLQPKKQEKHVPQQQRQQQQQQQQEEQHDEEARSVIIRITNITPERSYSSEDLRTPESPSRVVTKASSSLTHNEALQRQHKSRLIQPDDALMIPSPPHPIQSVITSTLLVHGDDKKNNNHQGDTQVGGDDHHRAANTPELASTTATRQDSSRHETSSQHSLQVTALPFRIMYDDGGDDDDNDGNSSCGSDKASRGSEGDYSKSDVAMAENMFPRASFVINRSLGDSSRPRLRSPQSTAPPAEVVIMRESFRLHLTDAGDDGGGGGEGSGSITSSVDLRARLVDTEQRAQFLECKLEASDDLIEALFVELESARKCIQKLVHRNVHLAALWREAENCLLKEPPEAETTTAMVATTASRSRSNTEDDVTDDGNDRRHQQQQHGGDFEDDDPMAHRDRFHQRHLKLLKYAIVLGLVFFLFGNTELFLAVAMFVGLTLEANT